MAKSKQGSHPAPEDSTQSFEKSIARVSTGVTKFTKDNKVALIVGLVVVMAAIGLYGLQGVYAERRVRNWNNRIYSVLSQNPDMIRSSYPGLLQDLDGTAVEPFAVLQVSNWLCAQDQTGDRDKALELVRGALGRHENSVLLSAKLKDLETVIAEDRTFEVPVSISAPTPLPGAPEAPAPVAPAPTAPTTPGEDQGAEGQGAADTPPVPNSPVPETPPPPPGDGDR